MKDETKGNLYMAIYSTVGTAVAAGALYAGISIMSQGCESERTSAEQTPKVTAPDPSDEYLKGQTVDKELEQMLENR